MGWITPLVGWIQVASCRLMTLGLLDTFPSEGANQPVAMPDFDTLTGHDPQLPEASGILSIDFSRFWIIIVNNTFLKVIAQGHS